MLLLLTIDINLIDIHHLYIGLCLSLLDIRTCSTSLRIEPLNHELVDIIWVVQHAPMAALDDFNSGNC